MTTKERLTGKEAYQMALRLREEGKSCAKVARELAREGYVSYKTGRIITPGGISMMVRLAKQGKFPTRDKSSTKDMSHLYRPRKKRTNALTATVKEIAGAKGITLPQLELPIFAMSGAMEELVMMSAKFKRTAAAIDTLIDAVK